MPLPDKPNRNPDLDAAQQTIMALRQHVAALTHQQQEDGQQIAFLSQKLVMVKETLQAQQERLETSQQSALKAQQQLLLKTREAGAAAAEDAATIRELQKVLRLAQECITPCPLAGGPPIAEQPHDAFHLLLRLIVQFFQGGR